jgi:hypothetical protein
MWWIIANFKNASEDLIWERRNGSNLVDDAIVFGLCILQRNLKLGGLPKVMLMCCPKVFQFFLQQSESILAYFVLYIQIQ